MTKSNVVSINGDSTPETFVSELAEHIDEVDSILAVVRWRDGTTSVVSTTMENWLRVWMSKTLDHHVNTHVFGVVDEGE